MTNPEASRQEKNVALAKWLDWRVTSEKEVDYKHQFFTYHCPACTCGATTPEGLCTCLDLCSDEPPDFYTSEEASALLLEKMPFPSLVVWEGESYHIIQGKYWQCTPEHNKQNTVTVIDADCKTAIAEACYRFIQGGEEKHT